MSRTRIVISGIVALIVIWSVAAAAIGYLRELTTTPDEVIRYIERHPLEGASPERRVQIVDEVARQVNELSFDQMHNFDLSREHEGAIRAFYLAMTPEERGRFLELTLQENMRQFMQALRGMDDGERRRMVRNAIRTVRRIHDDSFDDDPHTRRHRRPDIVPFPQSNPLEWDLTDPHFRELTDQAIRTFLNNATDVDSFDLAPLLQKVQQMMFTPMNEDSPEEAEGEASPFQDGAASQPDE